MVQWQGLYVYAWHVADDAGQVERVRERGIKRHWAAQGRSACTDRHRGRGELWLQDRIPGEAIFYDKWEMMHLKGCLWHVGSNGLGVGPIWLRRLLPYRRLFDSAARIHD